MQCNLRFILLLIILLWVHSSFPFALLRRMDVEGFGSRSQGPIAVRRTTVQRASVASHIFGNLFHVSFQERHLFRVLVHFCFFAALECRPRIKTRTSGYVQWMHQSCSQSWPFHEFSKRRTNPFPSFLLLLLPRPASSITKRNLFLEIFHLHRTSKTPQQVWRNSSSLTMTSHPICINNTNRDQDLVPTKYS